MLYIPLFGCKPGPCAWYERAGSSTPCSTFLQIDTGDINNLWLSVELGISPVSVGNPANPTCPVSGPYLLSVANYPGRVGVDVWAAWRDGRWTSSVVIRLFAGYRSGNRPAVPSTIRAAPGSFAPFLPLTQVKNIVVPEGVVCGGYPLVGTVTVFDDGTFTLV